MTSRILKLSIYLLAGLAFILWAGSVVATLLSYVN